MCCDRVVRAGAQGKTFVTRLIETMKEHKGSVNCIRVTKDDRRCVSASSDGTCIIWDLQCASPLLFPLNKQFIVLM